MNIYEALKQTDYRFAEYFKYLHPELRFDHDRPLKSEQEFLKTVNRKSMSPFYRWEKSTEYKNLLMLYLDYKVNDDYEQIYSIVSDKAKQGDEKAIRLFLTLQKDIQSMAKSIKKTFNEVEEIEEEDDLDVN